MAFEELEVWKRSARLSADLYREFSTLRDYGFKDQITRSALSVPSNIAEGYERGTGKSRIQFLTIAKGSCGELWTQLLIGRKAGFIENETGKKLELESKEISKMLYGLIQHFQKQQTKAGSRS